MYLRRIRHPANFEFPSLAGPQGSFSLDGIGHRFVLRSLGSDVHRLEVLGPRWAPHGSQAELARDFPDRSRHRLEVRPPGNLILRREGGASALLAGVPGRTFGACGAAWLFQFQHERGLQFYGLGEHNEGLEKSGQRVKFWNTDLFADFAHCEIGGGHPNPMYVAIPWLIVRRGDDYLGILVHNPGAVFMDLASNFVWDPGNPMDRRRRSFYVGAPGGRPELYFLVGPSLPELTQKLQQLVGRTPRPPLWSLGYHQCRWGYRGTADLRRLDRQFRAHRIPCDGLWLDIDYMDRYKVFTWSRRHFRNVRRELAALRRRGRRVVPILDPGIKVEPGYGIYEEALRAGWFCRNPTGRPFVGFVWPGQTHFPDFSRAEVRRWWAGHVRRFAAAGAAGSWLDMNDPSIGAVEPEDMLFGPRSQPHWTYHNQYALGMAQASRAGFLAARPDERPFLLSRSAFISSSRHAAVWTGDNVSNWHHLRMVLPVSLGLALSGLPFNGADLGGFAGDTTPELAVAWHKAAFLFPFCRNHSAVNTRPQEPWALGAAARRVIGRYIRLRYKFLPYLYQLFVAQEARGEAILRPLFYDFADSRKLPLGRVADQVMVGPSILQAPVLRRGARQRRVLLPGPGRWFGVHDGRWLAGGQIVRVRVTSVATPLYFREGALLPFQPGERTDNHNDLSTIELHCLLRRDSPVSTVGRMHYVADDGLSYGYARGEYTAVEVTARVGPGGRLELTAQGLHRRYRAVRVCFVLYDAFREVTLVQRGRSRRLHSAAHTWSGGGAPLKCRITDRITLLA